MKKIFFSLIIFQILFAEKFLIGVTMKKPIEEIINKVSKEVSPNNLIVKYGSSGALLKEALITNADIFLPGSDSYVKKIPKYKIINQQLIGYNKLVLAVQKGNPKHISSLKDLLRDDIKIGIGAPKLSSVGNYTFKILKKFFNKNDLEKIYKKASLGTQSRQLNAMLKYKLVDVIINWKGAIIAYKSLKNKYDLIPLSEKIAPPKKLILVQLKNSKFDNAFFNFATSKDGLEIMKKWGF